MAAFGRSLCLILTLWMAGSSPPTVIPPRSPDSSPWWDQASLKIQQNALRLRKAGDFRAADALYLEGYREAVRRRDRLASVRYLMSAGGCELLAFQYRAALASFLRARGLATAAGDHADLGAIAVNLSSLYLEMWDLSSANRAAEEGLRQTALLSGDATRGAYFKPHLLVQLGRIHSAFGDGQADAFFAAGIEAARATGDFALEAMAWDQQGAERLAAGRLGEAENRFLEAFRLRHFFRPGDLGWSYGHLGALAFAQHDFRTAERFTQVALDDAKRGAPAWPKYLLLQQQGRIRLARGEVSAALRDFSSALDATAQWRIQVLPARSSLISANVALEQQIFDSFIQLAARRALETGNPEWTAQAFQAVEINRAASLRESLALADVWREKLAPEYWETLAQLGTEEARGRGTETGGSRTGGTNANRLRLKLTEMEAEAGIGLQVKKVENFRSRISLIHFQEGLRGSELFLSFELGEKESYLWAVSRNSLSLYRLAAERDIAKSVQKFREAIPAGGAEAIRQGRQLYQQLFGQLKASEIQKPAWLLSLDGPLFNVPFAALVPGPDATAMYLVDTHTLQTVTGALLLNTASDSRSRESQRRGEFLGVGDPIYNQVDPRWRGPVSSRSSTGQLQRLVGSRVEVEASAKMWVAGGGAAVVLQGADAQRDAFLGWLERRPAVIHLATHVLFPVANRERGLIAFSLGDPRRGERHGAAQAGGSSKVSSAPLAAEPEFLTTSEIAELRVPGALVVMTGCATGSGEAQAGAGLLGLTRAWLMAGASMVVSTTWPVEDNSGGMFARFYFYLRNHSAAEALQLSQREAAHSRTGRQGPENWAMYQVTGGIH